MQSGSFSVPPQRFRVPRYSLEKPHPQVVEIDVVVRDGFFEFRVAFGVSGAGLAEFVQVVQVAVFHSLSVGIMEPSVHERDARLVGARFFAVKRGKVFARGSFVYKNPSGKRLVVDVYDIDPDIFRHFQVTDPLAPLDEVFLVWIRDFRPSIYRKIGVHVGSFFDSHGSCLNEL